MKTERVKIRPQCTSCSWFKRKRFESRDKYELVCANTRCPKGFWCVKGAIHESRIPPEFLKRDLYQLDRDSQSGPVVDFIKSYVALPPKWVVLVGPTGAGKTELGCQILRHAAVHLSAGIRYIHLPSYCDAIRNAENGNNPTEREIELREQHFEKVMNARLLLMDDLYMERFSEYRQRQLYDIIDHRWAYSLPTVLTTQLNVSELRSALTDKTVSRLKQRASFFKAGLADRRA